MLPLTDEMKVVELGPEVSNLYFSVDVEEDISTFNITMNLLFAMQVFDSKEKLPHNNGYINFGNAPSAFGLLF